ncbi:reverse transcriptase domain-containing protein [Tanacetum coccineum]
MPANFLIEIPSEDNEKKEKPNEVPYLSSKWRLYTDGASNSDGSGAGVMLIDPKGKEYTYALRFEFETMNNEAEYEALLAEPRSLVSRITKQGFYWPSMHRKVSKVMQDCEKCKEQSAIRKAGTSGAIAAGKHTEIMHHIRRQLTRSQQGWVDNLAKTLWIHRTLLRNSEKEIPFSLTYGSEAVIPIIETIDDRGVQKATKEKENKEVASIEKAYYQSKLRKYHNTRSSHPVYIVGDFILLKQNANE